MPPTGNGHVVVNGVFQGAFRPIGGPAALTLSTRTVAFTAAASFGTHSGKATTSVAGSGSGSGDQFVFSPTNTTRVQMCVYGSGASGSYWQAQIVGEKEVDQSGLAGETFYRRRHIGQIYGTLGGQVVTAGQPFGGLRSSDNIVVANDYTPGSGIRVAIPPTDGVASLVFDTQNNERIIVVPLNAVPSGASGSATTSINGEWSEF